MENRRLVELLVSGAVLVGSGALSIRLAETPWPGYLAGAIVLFALWLGMLRYRVNQGVAAAMQFGAQFGEHDYFRVRYLGGHPALPGQQDLTSALILTREEVLLYSEFRVDAPRLFAISGAQVVTAAVGEGAGSLEICYADQAGERHTVRFTVEDGSLEHLYEHVNRAVRSWRRRYHFGQD